MKSAATVFLAAFLALSASWAGFVLAPQLQIGRAPQVKPTGSDGVYPVARPGLAQQGAQVYRSLGCVYCHSQSVRQDGSICELVLTDAGTNAPATLAALAQFDKELAKPATLNSLPKVIKTLPDVPAALPMIKALKAAGATAEAKVSAQGPDIARGWGLRRSVAQDYAYEETVQIGTRRNGPDLANVGMTKPGLDWHLLHLYAPTAVVTGSTMPPYRFLFEQRKISRAPSPYALQLPGELALPVGYEVVPTEAARALAAYLVSLRVDVPLYEAPFTPLIPAAPATNAPAATNSPAK
jgi:cbb3-type cytochrome oxidase cytochrome c subunit